MTWMVIRLVLSLAFVGGVLWLAARLARKRGLCQGNGVIEVLARQRMGRASTVNVVRIGDTCLVVGATEEHVTLLAEVDPETVESLVRARPASRWTPSRAAPPGGHGEPPATEPPAAVAAVPSSGVPSSGVLAGTVFDRGGWSALVGQLRERTVRR